MSFAGQEISRPKRGLFLAGCVVLLAAVYWFTATGNQPYRSSISIPMQRQGGTYVVPVIINKVISLNFVVDSGAADVSIPADVVETLIRTGTVQTTDFVGKQTYILADGSTMSSETFRIRSLKVGDKMIENVTGSVAPAGGDLLLGQSFLGRFASWSVDNTSHALMLDTKRTPAPSGAPVTNPLDNAAAAYDRGDYATSLRLIRPLADQGNATAQNRLGSMYSSGLGVPQNNAEAAKWFRLAADQGHASAQNNLGILYWNGISVPQNYADAVTWFRLAADQGYAEAQFNLGSMYSNGPLPGNYNEAVKWYRLAADQGHPEAQYFLGVMYSLGQGVPRNDVSADIWFNLAAAAHGGQNSVTEVASNLRDFVEQRLAPAQLAEARKRAREWKPRSSTL